MHFAGWVVLAIGVALPLLAVVMARSSRLESTWERVAGVVTDSKVVNSGELYAPEVNFEFRHNGISLKGSKIRRHLLQFNWRGPADRAVARYPLGAAVSVYVDPQDPANSVLEPGGDLGARTTMTVVGALMVIVGIALIGSNG